MSGALGGDPPRGGVPPQGAPRPQTDQAGSEPDLMGRPIKKMGWHQGGLRKARGWSGGRSRNRRGWPLSKIIKLKKLN